MRLQEVSITFRLSKTIDRQVEKILRLTKYQEIYYNKSHFIRAAIIKELRRCENESRNIQVQSNNPFIKR